MFKKMYKMFAITILLVMLMATACYAEDLEALDTASEEKAATQEEATTSENLDETTGENVAEGTTHSEEEEMLEDDLYLIDSKIDYKRLVDGNAYIMGSDVSFSSMIGGDVFILGDNVTITKDAVIYGNLFVAGNNVTLDGFVYGGDFYVVCSNLTINGNVNRDMRAAASKVTFNGAVGRNVNIFTSDISIGENSQIYGNLNYSSKAAVEVPSGAVKGNINYNEISTDTSSNTVFYYVMNFVYDLVGTIFVLVILVFFAPKFLSNLEGKGLKDLLPALGIGLAGLIVVNLLAIILVITYIAAPVSIALIAVLAFAVLCLSFPIVAITVGAMLGKKVKVLGKAHNLPAIAICTLVLWALTQIPFFVGTVIKLIITFVGLGLIIINVWKNRAKKEN